VSPGTPVDRDTSGRVCCCPSTPEGAAGADGIPPPGGSGWHRQGISHTVEADVIRSLPSRVNGFPGALAGPIDAISLCKR
jgi:hypothetical protein